MISQICPYHTTLRRGREYDFHENAFDVVGTTKESCIISLMLHESSFYGVVTTTKGVRIHQCSHHTTKVYEFLNALRECALQCGDDDETCTISSMSKPRDFARVARGRFHEREREVFGVATTTKGVRIHQCPNHTTLSLRRESGFDESTSYGFATTTNFV